MTKALETSIDRALFEGDIDALVIAFHQNERPLCGLAGLMDWRFHGAISKYLRAGALSGKAGECAYVPMTRNGKVYHLFLAGAGTTEDPGKRGDLPAESVRALSRNLASLGLKKVAASKADVGKIQLKGVNLWIAP